MATPKRGEVWIADLGLAAKPRPVLVLSVPYSDEDYALLAAIPHTTSTRESSFEVNLSVAGLRSGAFNVQGLLAIPAAKMMRKVAQVDSEQMRRVETVVSKWLGFAK